MSHAGDGAEASPDAPSAAVSTSNGRTVSVDRPPRLRRVTSGVSDFLRSDLSGVVGVVLILSWILLAIFASALAPYSPVEIFTESILQSPSSAHWFGTDINGMDVFSRVLHAARLDLQIAVTAVGISMVIGVFLGLVTGYLGGWVDMIVLRVLDVLQAFPALILGLAIVAALQRGIASIIIVIAFLDIPIYARLIRAETFRIRETNYIEAARALGNPTWRILSVHVLPNSLPPVVIQSAVRLAWAVKITASLAFVGVGIQAPVAEWGSMIRVGSDGIMAGVWWPTVFPGLAVVTLVLGLNLLADALQSFLRPGGRR
jgi:peptide/nickel transport system permease protein